jgi:hypothetical protein
MHYELLVFWMLAVILSCTSMITITLLTKCKPLIMPDMAEAQNYIRNKIASQFIVEYDWIYLEHYLSIHLVKYPNGKLPQQAGQVIYSSEHCKHTLNFIDCQDQRIVKYIKPCIKLLREAKPKKTSIKRLDVLAEANQVLKSKRTRKVKELVNV